MTSADRAGELAQHIGAICAVDIELADLAFERDTLQQRQHEERQAADAVSTAGGFPAKSTLGFSRQILGNKIAAMRN